MKEKRNSHKIIIDAVNNYFENKCNYCGSTDNLHIHHIIPLSKGGQNVLGNMELVCRNCHIQLHVQLEKVSPKKDIPILHYCKKCGIIFMKKIKLGGELCNFCISKKYRDSCVG